MQHAGYLTPDNSITHRAKSIFLKHRDDLIVGESSFKFPCVEINRSDVFTANLPVRDVTSENVFKSFYENWVYGIYQTCLNILNVESNINPSSAGIYFDIFALGEKINRQPVTGAVLEQQDFKTFFKSCFPTPIAPSNLTIIGTKDFLVVPDATPPVPPAIGQTEFVNNINNIVEPFKVPVADKFVTNPPNKNFPDLVFNNPPGYNLEYRQKKFYAGVVDALQRFTEYLSQFFSEIIANFDKNFELALEALYGLACAVLQVAFPQLGISDGEEKNDKIAISENINRNALRRSLVKPLVIASFSLLFGTHEKGLSRKWMMVEPDTISPEQAAKPKEEKVKIEEYKEKDQTYKPSPGGNPDDSIIYMPRAVDELQKILNQQKSAGNADMDPIAKVGMQNKSQEFLRKLFDVATKLYKDNKGHAGFIDFLTACIYFETAGTFSAEIRAIVTPKKTENNPNPKPKLYPGTGLIQWTQGGCTNKSYKLENVRAASDLQQLDFLAEYYKNAPKSAFANYAKTYVWILNPGSTGYSKEKDKNAYEANQSLDTDNDGTITPTEMSKPISNLLYKFLKTGKRINVNTKEIIDVQYETIQPEIYQGKFTVIKKQ